MTERTPPRRPLPLWRPPFWRTLVLALAALLGGCAVYAPYPGYYGYPAYAGGYYAAPPPVVGGVYVGGGWGWGHRHWR